MDAPPTQQSVEVSARATRRGPWIAATIATLVALYLTHAPTSHLLSRMVVPDSLEYAAGAQRIATLGRFDLPIGDQALPSRYPPTFAALLAPAYWIRPGDFFAGIWACRIYWAIGCGAIAFALSRRVGATAALLVAVSVAAHPVVLDYASTILSDAPALAGLLVLIAIRAAAPAGTQRTFAVAGVALAFTVACRSLSLAYALPFCLMLPSIQRGRWRAIVCMLAPSLGVIAINSIYNRLRFGSFAMNGYVYWCAMPYSQFDYVFHPQYFSRELAALLAERWFTYPAVASVIASFLLYRVARPLWTVVVAPTLLSTVPLTTLYLFYFFHDERLFLPILLAAFLPGVLAIAAFLGRSRTGRRLAAMATIAIAFRSSLSVTPPIVRQPTMELLAQLHECLPQRCWLITTMDPITIEAFVTRGTDRHWIPAMRDQEYADKVLADRPLDLSDIPRPSRSLLHRQPVLLLQGARLAVAETAEDDALLDRLTDAAGPAVFIDRTTFNLLPMLRDRLAKRFDVRPLVDAPAIIECVPRGNATTRPAVIPQR